MDGQYRMHGIARLRQRLFRPGLPIHKHDDIFHDQPNTGQFFDGFEFASAGGGKIINDYNCFSLEINKAPCDGTDR